MIVRKLRLQTAEDIRKCTLDCKDIHPGLQCPIFNAEHLIASRYKDFPYAGFERSMISQF